jgi:hypothetical protein
MSRFKISATIQQGLLPENGSRAILKFAKRSLVELSQPAGSMVALAV